jgi:imidazolonepropionase-like amidohydrolase
MTRQLVRVFASAWLALALAPGAHAAGPDIVFRHVNVIDVKHGAVDRDKTLVSSGARITKIESGRSAAIPRGARVVNATGKFLIPGLWDMHAHNFNYVSGRPPRTWQFPLFIANGVTGVRDMWVKPADMRLIRKWRAELDRGHFIGPRFGAVGTIVDGPWDAKPGNFPGPNVEVAATPEQARKIVDELQAAGIDFFKPYNSLSRDVYLAVIREAKRRNFPVGGHVPWAVGARLASASGQRSLEHQYGVMEACSSKEPELSAQAQKNHRWTYSDDALLVDNFDVGRCTSLARQFVHNHTAITPTLVELRYLAGTETVSFFTDDRRMASIPQDEADAWQGAANDLRAGLAKGTLTPEADAISARWWKELFISTRLMQRQGVLILAGTDVGNPFIYPGSSLLDELTLLHQAGLTPIEALRTATLNPAIFLGIEDRFGTVEQGKTADLVLLDANPLADIENVRQIDAVVLNGRLFDRAQLASLQAHATSR